MIAIVIALPSEAKALLECAQNLKEFKLADKPAYTCTLSNKEVVVAISGIGKVSAALTTQLLIDKYSPDYVLNFGTCGGTNSKVQALNYYLIEKCCQFDFDVRELDDVPLGYIQEYDTVYFTNKVDFLDFLPRANLASADRFTDNQKDIDSINEMGCSIRDMEGGAIAQVCTSNNIPLYMIKGVSDVIGNGTAQEQFYQNLKAVGSGFPDIILKSIDAIK
jgi:adenosylhomocysteine nucleosidase